LVFWKRKIFLSKKNFGGKKINLAKKFFNLAKTIYNGQFSELLKKVTKKPHLNPCHQEKTQKTY
jgi:hypothetical protein